MFSEEAVSKIVAYTKELMTLAEEDIPNAGEMITEAKKLLTKSVKSALSGNVVNEFTPWLAIETDLKKCTAELVDIPAWHVFRLKEEIKHFDNQAFALVFNYYDTLQETITLFNNLAETTESQVLMTQSRSLCAYLAM